MTAAKRIAGARTALVLDHPFFGSLALRLKVEEAPQVTNTMATNGRTLFYSAEYVEKQTDAQLVGLIAHEVMHPAMQHHTRRDAREHRLWNIACDYAINPILHRAGFVLPEGGLENPAFDGQSAEQIFDQLAAEQNGGRPIDGSGRGRPQPQGNGPQQQQPGAGPQQPNGPQQPGAGQPDPNDVSDIPGAVLDAPDPITDAGEWEVAVTQAERVSSMMGDMPGELRRALGKAREVKVDWRAIMRRFVQQTAAADYSWKMPNRRYLAGGLYMPELRSEALPAIVVAIDTSGSIDQPALNLFTAELQSIIDEARPESVHVIYCDRAIHGHDVFAQGEPIVMNPVGGGGTSFRPVFDLVDDEQLAPACLIYFTDGYGHFPDEAPEYPVLWALTGTAETPWGEDVRIS